MSTDTVSSKPISRFVLFAYGFRPFFLLVGLWAIAPIAVVWWAVSSGVWPTDAIPLYQWHAHEMIFGFAAAAVAGFLLTAVPTWTGASAVSGCRLVGLLFLWGMARVVSLPFLQSSNLMVEVLGLAFFPALGAAIATPLIRTKNFRNLPFLLILSILFIADVLFQAPHYGWINSAPVDALRLAINTLTLVVAIVGGRIIPAFTKNALLAMGREAPVKSIAWLDRGAIATVAAVLAGDLVALNSTVSGFLAAFAAALLAARLSRWGGLRTIDIPLLWILHLGYSWLIIGLALKAAWLLGSHAWAVNWMHALTAGAFGTMILGVATRVALGHTGRPLAISRLTVTAYLFITAAAGFRVWGPWIAPDRYLQILSAAMLSWILAYGLFLFVYTPILVSPRVDGKKG